MQNRFEQTSKKSNNEQPDFFDENGNLKEFNEDIKYPKSQEKEFRLDFGSSETLLDKFCGFFREKLENHNEELKFETKQDKVKELELKIESIKKILLEIIKIKEILDQIKTDEVFAKNELHRRFDSKEVHETENEIREEYIKIYDIEKNLQKLLSDAGYNLENTKEYLIDSPHFILRRDYDKSNLNLNKSN